jgi:hypothetical protein
MLPCVHGNDSRPTDTLWPSLLFCRNLAFQDAALPLSTRASSLQEGFCTMTREDDHGMSVLLQMSFSPSPLPDPEPSLGCFLGTTST